MIGCSFVLISVLVVCMLVGFVLMIIGCSMVFMMCFWLWLVGWL